MSKTAVICGIGPVGVAAAKALKETGLNIVLLDEDNTKAQAAARKLGDGTVAIPYYPRDEATVDEAMKKAFEAFGEINGLLNANLKIQRAQTKDVTGVSIKKAFEENVVWYLYNIKAAAKYMVKSGGGRIVNLSSVHSQVADGYHLEYAAVTNAISAMTRELSVSYWKDNIQVNTLVAAFVDGQYPDGMDMDQRQVPEQISLLGRRLTPEDIAKTIRFLLTSSTKIVTGSEIRADAGYLTTQYRVGDTPFVKITD